MVALFTFLALYVDNAQKWFQSTKNMLQKAHISGIMILSEIRDYQNRERDRKYERFFKKKQKSTP